MKNKIEKQILDQALDWLLILDEEDLSKEQLHKFENWKNQSTQHLEIWLSVENTFHKLDVHSSQLPRTVTKNILTLRNNKTMPYKFLCFVFIGAGVLSTFIFTYPDYIWMPDYQTKYGEQKAITLEDGTQILLNSKTAVDINYDQNKREIALKYGEIHIETAKDLQHRPFTVLNQQGTILALGTVFNVKQNESDTTVSVIEHAVQISPIHSKEKQILKQGYSVQFDGKSISKQIKNESEDLLWQKGLMIVNRLKLNEFTPLIEKHYGISVEIDPNVSDPILSEIEISGTYPIYDSMRLIELLEKTYPIKIKTSFFFKKWVITKK